MKKRILCPLIFILIAIVISSCNRVKYNCVDFQKIDNLPKEYFLKKADTIHQESQELMKEVREKEEKYGLLIETRYNNLIPFEQNCNSTYDLDVVYNFIALLQIEKDIKLRIVGNADSVEIKTSPKISLERAKFIRAIFLKNGVKKNRLELFDAKDQRPVAPIQKRNTLNRRVYIEIFR